MMKRATVLLLMLAAAPAMAQAPSGGDTAGSGTAKAPVPVTGQQVYQQVCQACHMADAKGGEGAGHIPALAKNTNLEDAGYPIGMIVQGRGAMPSLTDLLSPKQIAAVTGYIRTHFGNHYGKPVSEADVKAVLGQ
jgi:mono/diheme cytochrome c family protein